MSFKHLTMMGTAVCLLLFASLIRVEFVAIIALSTSDAILSVRFLDFSNPRGKGSNGRCCDGALFFCLSKCDHSFTICLDRSDGPSHIISQCSYGRTVSGEIRNENHMTFRNTIGSIANPVVWKINSWPGSARLKIDIIDVDPGRDDDVDFLQTVLSLAPINGRNRLHFTLRNRVNLAIEAQLYCGHNYYGLTCAVHCVPRDDYLGHYTCNTQTGSKICLSGWVGSACNTNEDNCIGNKCQNGGICKDMTNRYECVCPAGFKGNLCDQDVNECLKHDICDHGICENQPGSYICKCFPGYTGDTCGININDCLPSPCHNGATCHDLVDDFLCSCPAGFTGKRCDEDINECQLSPCSNNGTCVNYAGGHRCDCLSGYHGNDCSLDVDECNHSPCKNKGVCTNFQGGYSCQCPTGFEGFHCDSDIDECENSNITCHNGGSCINTPGSYTCQCVKGFEGQNCETNVNECLSGPCKHNATCHDLIGSYSCDCTQGYTGQNCEHNINECLDDVCNHGGTCTDLEGGFACKCSEFWEGQTCEENINECLSHPCKNGGTCENVQEGFYCICPAEFIGTLCEADMNECELDNTCHNNATCTNSFGSFTCVCMEGWTGLRCDDDINECELGHCNNLGTCVNTHGGFQCECPINWQGTRCQDDVNECAALMLPCRNNATCHNILGAFHCECAEGWTGPLCDVDINECMQVPDICKTIDNNTDPDNFTDYHTLCTNTKPGYRCTCQEGWTGPICNEDINECVQSPNICETIGNFTDSENFTEYHTLCTNTKPGYLCTCQEGWTGPLCNEDINECVQFPNICETIGNFTDSENFTEYHTLCTNTKPGYLCTCQEGWNGSLCNEDIDECVQSPNICDTIGNFTDSESSEEYHTLCANTKPGYLCTCQEGWTGPLCNEDINECVQSPNICEKIGNFTDSENSTEYHTLCTNTKPGYLCTCQEGWTGPLCNEDINECVQSPNICETIGNFTDSENFTEYHTLCTNTKPGYLCTCQEGWNGPLCNEDIDECVQSPNICDTIGNSTDSESSEEYNTLCTNTKPGYLCTCQEGWTGPLCNEDINECVQSPNICEKIGNFTDSESSDEYHTLCANTKPGYLCTCQEGWNGPLCNEDIDECVQSPNICETIGNFTDSESSQEYHTLCANTKPGYLCTCQEGWNGPLCNEDIDECVQSPNICETIGNFTDSESSEEYHTLCTNTKPGYLCTCQEGWTGPLCNEDINECVQSPNICETIGNFTDSENSTEYHTLCINTKPGYLCTCQEGWTGPLCNEDINECLQSPDICIAEFIHTRTVNASNYHTLCVNSNPGYFCICREGWTGELCDEDIDECLENPFLCSFLDNSTDNNTLPVGSYHAACVNTYPGFLCTCSEGWAGENCDKDIGTTTPSLDSTEHYDNDTLDIYDSTTQRTNGTGYSHKVSVSEINTTEITRETIPNAEIGDETTEVYSGITKLPVNEKSTTNDTAVNMEENHNITRGQADISVPFYLACTIEPNMEWTVDKGLKQMFMDSHLFEGKELTVSHRSQAETFKDGQTATSIYPNVTVNGKELSDQEISFVLNKESHKIQDYLDCPLFLDAAQQSVAFSSAHLNSSTTVWYPGLIAACACLLVAVILIFIVKSRRGMKAWFLHKFTGIKPEMSVLNPVYIPASGVQETEQETDFRQFLSMNDNELNSAAEYDVTYGQQELTD